MQPRSTNHLVDECVMFSYVEGGVSRVISPYTTGWRSLPYAVLCRWQETTVRVDLDEGVILNLEEDEGVIIPPGARHCVTTLSTTTGLCIWGHADYTALGAISLLSMLGGIQVLAREQAKPLADTLQELAESGAMASSGLAVIAKRNRLGFQLLEIMCGVTELAELTSQYWRQTARLQPALQYIYDHYSGAVSRAVLARTVGLSPTHFHNLFKKTMGVAPMVYVQRLRIQRARAMLVETNLSVASVAEKVGFADQFYFSRQFKRYSGLSPSQYRSDTRKSLFPASEAE